MQMQIKTQYAFLMSNHQQKGSVSLAPYNKKAHAILAADTPISQSRRPREKSGFARLDNSLEPSTSQFRCHAPRVSCAEPRGGGPVVCTAVHDSCHSPHARGASTSAYLT